MVPSTRSLTEQSVILFYGPFSVFSTSESRRNTVARVTGSFQNCCQSLCLPGFGDVIIVTILQVCTKDLPAKFILTAFDIQYNFHYGIRIRIRSHKWHEFMRDL